MQTPWFACNGTF